MNISNTSGLPSKRFKTRKVAHKSEVQDETEKYFNELRQMWGIHMNGKEF